MHTNNPMHSRYAVWLMLLVAITSTGLLCSSLVAEKHARLDKALIQACRHGNDAAVRRLLQQGANPNAHISQGFIRQFHDWPDGPPDDQEPLDTTALVEAAAQGHSTIARLLIENGARVNARCRYEAPDAEGYDPRRDTAIKWARNRNHVDTVRILEQAGATE